MHILGLQGMPRRVATYAAKFADLNLFISIASFGARPEHADLRLQHGHQLARRADARSPTRGAG